ncbi:MAG: MCP four helix bundle domain-containing protein [Cytophagia bacterium]|nr:MCP four helix bundle domain-containing protein [Cytophagia bacterium]
MKWTYGIQQKMTAAAVLATVMALIIINNISERRRFQKLESSISSIYQDRLLVESYIFKLYNNLQNQNDYLQNNMGFDASAQLKALKAERDELVHLYSETYLTPDEELHFEALQKTLNEFDNNSGNRNLTNKEAIEHLNALSNIQTDEGTSLWSKSERLISGSQISSKFEMAIIICLGIIIQALIFSSRSLKPKTVIQKHHLN